MTDNDLRMDYKRDTGLNADLDDVEEVEIDQHLTLHELSELISIDIERSMDDIPYVVWLEEKLIKALAK